MRSTFFAACLLMASTTTATTFYNSGYGAYDAAMAAGANEHAMHYR